MRYAQELRLPELDKPDGRPAPVYRCSGSHWHFEDDYDPYYGPFQSGPWWRTMTNCEERPIKYPPCTGPLYAQGMGDEPLQAGSVTLSGYYDLRKYRGDVLWCTDKHGRTTEMLWPEGELSLTPWGAPPAYEEGSSHARQSGGEGSSHARQSVWGKEKK